MVNIGQPTHSSISESVTNIRFCSSCRFSPDLRSAQYTVLATDYTSFAAVYTCQNVGLTRVPLYHRRDVYLLTRDRTATISADAVQQVSGTSTAAKCAKLKRGKAELSRRIKVIAS